MSSGTAATLLLGGRTDHSALKFSLNMQFIETPTGNISKASGMEKVLQKCKVIVWDESTMKFLINHCKICTETSDHLEPNNIACRRFQTTITYNSLIDTSKQNKCLPEILYFVVTYKVEIN
ncbi:hypothetical protein CEXT_696731 [Caerostris extrusa]|uniref:ATP-dependent DNA helicase n=1 Tax=Caerostris extrusa TaxID=172846 RepID=A0AAV4Y855_CAEEX|nr:hypothetical protein CEXT_696731 [Caerostris extrusa]